jgi:fructosamine-3-kinase
MKTWQIIAQQISLATGHPFKPSTPRSIGGGCINSAFCISDDQMTYFVKQNRRHQVAMFEAEAQGLRALASANAIRIPHVICTGVTDDHAFLVMDYITFAAPSQHSSRDAGRQLATLHAATKTRYGWTIENTIGSTPQDNTRHDDWATFWNQCRLTPQLNLAARRGYGGRLQRLGEQLSVQLPALLNHQPPPSLLHGDLWGGNIGYTTDGAPVLFDPAVYYGDRETDLAMTELFGGFSASFYAAYHETWPIDQAGYTLRKTIYNLYHILNHLNLFGGGYLRQAETMMEQVLAAVRA